MKSLHLIVVGKLGDELIAKLESDYLKRLPKNFFQIHEVKSHSENLELESKEVLHEINLISKNDSAFLVLLAENGKQFDSPKFSEWIFEKIPNQKIIFIIGGAAGHGKKVIEAAHFKLSLSEMTYPHKLARLLFVEQIYRAMTIKDHHPYHK
jgi:23S rRNA (pseudouridine1915-N3)-methyltransferase